MKKKSDSPSFTDWLKLFGILILLGIGFEFGTILVIALVSFLRTPAS